MTTQEVQRIEVYLKSKKLSKPLFLELKDHFMIQIEHEMVENNLDFENTFLKVKFKWKNELQMIKADFLSFTRVARIEREYLKNIFRNILTSSIGVSILLGIATWEFPDIDFLIKITLLLAYLCFGLFALFTKKLNLIELWEVGFQPISLKIVLLVLVIPFGVLFLVGEKYTFDNSNFFLSAPLLDQTQLIYYQIKNYKVVI